ncbi:MAG: type II toxin-antitoxin system RelE/ParE family toxin [Casimicrobiaceae bacterium]
MRRSDADKAGLIGPEKPLAFSGSSLADLRAFPETARRQAGRQLWRVQHGIEPLDWKPMSIVGPGTIEIRIHTGREHRVFVVARFEEAVYVLHVFEKKSQKTPQREITVARQRYQDLVQRPRKP